MKNEWYCDLLGEVVGPLSASKLLAMVRAGEINSDTPLRKDDSQWVPAMEVNGLFEAATKSEGDSDNESNHLCPYCGGEVKKAPTKCGNCERTLQRAIPKKAKEKKKVTRKQSWDGPTPSKNNVDQKEEGSKKKSAWTRFWSGD